jgi:hypothetical protein
MQTDLLLDPKPRRLGEQVGGPPAAYRNSCDLCSSLLSVGARRAPGRTRAYGLGPGRKISGLIFGAISKTHLPAVSADVVPELLRKVSELYDLLRNAVIFSEVQPL